MKHCDAEDRRLLDAALEDAHRRRVGDFSGWLSEDDDAPRPQPPYGDNEERDRAAALARMSDAMARDIERTLRPPMPTIPRTRARRRSGALQMMMQRVWLVPAYAAAWGCGLLGAALVGVGMLLIGIAAWIHPMVPSHWDFEA